MNNITVFAHYDLDSQIKDYVLYYLQQLKTVSHKIIFVSTSTLSIQEQKKLSGIVDKIIIRKNVGYDFHSYKIGIESIECLNSYDNLILCNDSCFGPLFPLTDVFAIMDHQAIDFWGITSSNLIRFHLQSYFLVFNQSILQSTCFMKFWQNLPLCENRKDIIFNYEITLSQILITNGYHANSYIPLTFKTPLLWLVKRHVDLLIKKYLYHTTNYSTLGNLLKLRKTEDLDKTIIFWDYLIKTYKMPFLKKNILTKNISSLENVTKQISNITSYTLNKFI